MVENVFILAGGAGTRLWPASNKSIPKQFLEIENGKSLLYLTIERALSLAPEGEIYIITLQEQMHTVIDECRKLGKSMDKIVILPEPEPRNTAPAIAAAAGYLRRIGRGSERALVMPADHLITPVEDFKRDVEKADGLAKQKLLVTFGVTPLYPATGYGYIEAGEKNKGGFRVKRFREKPDKKTAQMFLKQGNFYWNSGMFVFTLDAFWNELVSGAPGIAEVFKEIGKFSGSEYIRNIRIILNNNEVKKIYSSSPKDSIDYAVMEKSNNTAVIPASFDWNDIGSWDEMADIGSGQEKKTKNQSDIFQVESRNNFIFSDIPVALCGVEDLMVIQKNGVLLVCKKGKGQLVKDVVEKIRTQGRDDLL